VKVDHDQRHQDPHRDPPRPAEQHVPDAAAPLVQRLDRELVPALDPGLGVEDEAHPAARLVFGHGVADRAVPAVGTDLERTVQPQRRPLRPGPELVLGSAEPVDQPAHSLGRRLDRALVHVPDHRVHLPYGSVRSTIR
jgi:hypothetical protein